MALSKIKFFAKKGASKIMQVSAEFKEALKKVALGFTSSVVVEEYLTIAEFEEKLKNDYGKNKKGKTSGEEKKQLAENENGGVLPNSENLANENSENDIQPKKGRPKDKYRMICVKKKIDQKYHPPEVSGLKMLMEIEKDNEKSNIEKLVEDVRSMTMDELLEFRYKLLLDLNKTDD